MSALCACAWAGDAPVLVSDHVGDDGRGPLAVSGYVVHRHLFVFRADEEQLAVAADAVAEFDVVYARRVLEDVHQFHILWRL